MSQLQEILMKFSTASVVAFIFGILTFCSASEIVASMSDDIDDPAPSERFISVDVFVKTSDDNKELGGWRIQVVQGQTPVFDNTWGWGENWDNDSEKPDISGRTKPLDVLVTGETLRVSSSIEEREGEVRIDWGIKHMEVVLKNNRGRELRFERNDFKHKSRGDGGALQTLDLSQVPERTVEPKSPQNNEIPGFGPQDKVETESINLRHARDSHHVIQAFRGLPDPPPAKDQFPYSYGGDPGSIDSSMQVEVVAFDKDTINLRGPRAGLDIILHRIAQIDVPQNETSDIPSVPKDASASSGIGGQVIAAFAFGIVFVVTLLVLAMKFPNPTPFQYNVFRIVLALAGAGVAAMIPGFIDVQLNPTVGLFVRAGGALAVFIILFFFNPAQLAAQKPPNPGE